MYKFNNQFDLYFKISHVFLKKSQLSIIQSRYYHQINIIKKSFYTIPILLNFKIKKLVVSSTAQSIYLIDFSENVWTVIRPFFILINFINIKLPIYDLKLNLIGNLIFLQFDKNIQVWQKKKKVLSHKIAKLKVSNTISQFQISDDGKIILIVDCSFKIILLDIIGNSIGLYPIEYNFFSILYQSVFHYYLIKLGCSKNTFFIRTLISIVSNSKVFEWVLLFNKGSDLFLKHHKQSFKILKIVDRYCWFLRKKIILKGEYSLVKNIILNKYNFYIYFVINSYKVIVNDLNTLQVLKKIKFDWLHITTLLFYKNLLLISSYLFKDIVLIDLILNKPMLFFMKQNKFIKIASISRDHSVIFIVTKNYKSSIFRLPDYSKKISVFNLVFEIHSISFFNNSFIIILLTSKGKLYLYALNKFKLKLLSNTKDFKFYTLVEVDCKDEFIIAACKNFNLMIWHVNSGRLLKILFVHTASITKLYFIENSIKFITSSLDNSLKINKISISKNSIASFIHDCEIIDHTFNKKFNSIISLTKSNFIHLWDIASLSLKKLISTSNILSKVFKKHNECKWSNKMCPSAILVTKMCTIIYCFKIKFS